jgi:hypothetical protein
MNSTIITDRTRSSLLRQLGLTCAAAFLAAIPLRAENIIRNGGFEDGRKSWWGGGLKTGGIVAENPSEGAGSLKVTGGFVCQDKITVSGGKSYKITMKIRSDAQENSVYVQLSFRGEGVGSGWHGPVSAEVGGRKEKAVFVTGGQHEWKEFSTVITTPGGANQMLLYLRKIPGSAGAAFYDNVNVEPVE